MYSIQSQIKQENLNKLFPVFLKLEQLHTLVIGGGSVGLEKVNAILKNSPAAKITLIAPSVKSEILKLQKDYENLSIIRKEFSLEDLNDKDIVIAAANDKELNSLIKQEAQKRKILTNVADTPHLCDFYLSSIVQKGSLKLAISTNGKSPTIAKRIKEILHDSIPDDIENSLDNLSIIRSRLNGDFSYKVKKLNEITSVLAVNPPERSNKLIPLFLFSLLLMISGHLLLQHIPFVSIFEFVTQSLSAIDSAFYLFIAAGFIAQMIDGMLGMAYGVSASTFLLAFGVPPAAVSASVHTSEIFTSGASGLSHLKFGNLDRTLFKKIVIPGVIGSVTGAVLLSSLTEYGFLIRPFIASYTLILGIIIIRKAFSRKKASGEVKRIKPLAGAGGFIDAIGGGGWGPVVASTLIAKGKQPVKVVGAVNLAEFFVTLASSSAFLIFLGITHWQIVAGLIVGGVIAAPIAAKIAGKLHYKTALIFTGALVILISLQIILTIIFK